MAFIEDKLWHESKRIAKFNGVGDDWVEVMDYYTLSGGSSVIVQSILDDKAFRILCIADSGEVVCLDTEGNVAIKSYDEVNVSKKLFIYNISDKELVHLELPSPTTVCDKNYLELKL